MKKLLLWILVVGFPLLGLWMVAREINEDSVTKITIFHASGLTPLLDGIRENVKKDLNIELVTEASGSQVACRKVTELGKECDLLMLADNSLVPKLLSNTVSWRMDFAADEVVIGVGSRAKFIQEMEADWVDVLLNKDVRFGRVDENQGPIGYRCLLVWKLQEMQKEFLLYDQLLKKCRSVVDHVTRLTPLLKNGELDYAFVYKSICVAQDIRYISLSSLVNLGSPNIDYSDAVVSFTKLQAGKEEKIEVEGQPICWTLTSLNRGDTKRAVLDFVKYLLDDNSNMLEKAGFTPFEFPKFYGDKTAKAAAIKKEFSGFSIFSGQLKDN